MAGLKYNERTGEFEERPSGRMTGGGCARRLLQVALAVAAFAATAWIVAKWETGWHFVCEAGDCVAIAAMMAVIGAFVWFYAKALSAVKRGHLVAYLGWEDFFKSAAWIVAIPFGLVCTFSDGNNLFTIVLGLVMTGFGVKSFVRMVKGAFRYNSGNGRWLALFARVAVILLLLFALSELQSRFERYRRGQLGLIRGVLLPLAIFAYFYKAFVAPMIGIRWRRR